MPSPASCRRLSLTSAAWPAAHPHGSPRGGPATEHSVLQHVASVSATASGMHAGTGRRRGVRAEAAAGGLSGRHSEPCPAPAATGGAGPTQAGGADPPLSEEQPADPAAGAGPAAGWRVGRRWRRGVVQATAHLQPSWSTLLQTTCQAGSPTLGDFEKGWVWPGVKWCAGCPGRKPRQLGGGTSPGCLCRGCAWLPSCARPACLASAHLPASPLMLDAPKLRPAAAALCPPLPPALRPQGSMVRSLSTAHTVPQESKLVPRAVMYL